MFEPTSRYFDLETACFVLADGHEVRYVRRRFLPAPGSGTVLTEHRVTDVDRLDHIAFRYLGDPELYWQLADVNNAMRPHDLTAEVGRTLTIATLPDQGSAA